MIPQVIVTLAPDGTLIAELPGPNGMRRQIPLTRDCAKTLTRMLQAQLRSEVALGLDGGPTAHQVRHWERHATFRDAQCPFCRAEIDRENRTRRSSRQRPRNVLVGDGSVIVRRIEQIKPARKILDATELDI